MDYEEYKKKLEKVKEVIEILNELNDSTIARVISLKLQNVFPEVRESEDERIRTGLINGFKECLKDSQYPKNVQKYWHNIKIEDILAWMKKQADKDKLIKELGKYKVKYMQEVLSQQLEKQSEWSEEDEIRLDRICKTLWKNRKGDTDEIYQQEQDINWLKSLRPGKQWKPSKEQIIALRWVLNNILYNKHKEEISGLLDQIKDL